MIHNKIEETDGRFLIGQDEEKEVANWSTLFDGSQPLVVHKSVLSQSKTSTPLSSPKPNSSPSHSSKKRRAPPPPPDREPYAPPICPARPPLPASLHPPAPYQEKENSGTCTSRPAVRSKTGRPSLDAKFSAIIQQLQRNNTGGSGALSRKNAPLGVLDIQPQSQPPPPLQQVEYQSSEATGEPGFFSPSHGPGPVPAPRSKLRKSFRERMNLKALWPYRYIYSANPIVPLIPKTTNNRTSYEVGTIDKKSQCHNQFDCISTLWTYQCYCWC